MKTIKKYIFLLLQFCAIGLSKQLFAQYPHPTFKHYTVEEGLASSEVYQVKQDSKGYIWFATANGVSRFNGYEFENFSMTNGLPDNTVFEIYEDDFERIWFVPISCKLSYYYKGKIYQFRYNDKLQKELKNPIKTSFCVDKKGTIYLGLVNDGVYQISQDGVSIHTKPSIDSKVGLFLIEPNSKQFIYGNRYVKEEHVSYKIKFNSAKLNGVAITQDNFSVIRANTRIIQTTKNKLLVTYQNKLYIFDGLNDYKIEQFATNINWLYEDKDGDLWVGTFLGGVYHIINDDFENKRCYLENITVDGVIQDHEGGFWFATEGDAVYYSPSKHVLTFDKSSGLKDNRTTCLGTNGDQLYVGLQSGFAQQLSEDSILSTYNCNVDDQRSNFIGAFFYDSIKNKMWVSAKMKDGFLSEKKFIKNAVACTFNEMLLDHENNYWLAYSNGLGKLANEKLLSITSKNPLLAKRINALLLKQDNNLLLGAIDGLWEFNIKNYSVLFKASEHPLLQSRILDLAYVLNQTLVVATKGKGLLLCLGKNVHQINTQNGLCGDNVYKVAVADSVIWAATNRGLSKIVLIKQYPLKYRITNYTKTAGIASDEVNDVLCLNGNVWVATNKGVSFFNQNLVNNISDGLPVYVSQVLINDSDSLVKDNYELSYDQNNIKIKFIALGYKDAGVIQYRYKMIGLDTNWSYTTNREIQFTTLPANNYKFILSVLKPNGEWSDGIKEVRFKIYLPFWKKDWFILLVIGLGFYFMFVFLKYRLAKEQEEEKRSVALKRSLLNLKLKALRAQMNPHFTFNVMNSIQYFIVNKDDESAHRYLSKFSKLIRTVLNNSEENAVILSEEIKALELYLELEAMRFEREFEYKIVVDPAIDVNEVEIPSMLIQPYVENAIKHGVLPSPTKGKININIEKQSGSLKCIIEDNGIGRRKAARRKNEVNHKSFGTFITQERLSVINQLYSSDLSETIIDLYDDDGNGIGTRVELFIPII